MTVAQLEMNVELDPRAFSVVVPADADTITLEELRAAGPLGTGRTGGQAPDAGRSRR
jgi:hypothetical protein